MEKIYNKDNSKKVYIQPSIQKLGLISEKTKTNQQASSRDNVGAAVVEKGS